jgi:site-specific DNA recombinase
MQEIKTISKTLAAVYVRVSTSKQEKWSPDAQRRVLLDHCTRMGWEPVVYSETGSGETLEGRPEIRRLLRDAEKKQFNICLVVEMERLSRDKDLLDWLEIKKIFRDADIKIATPGQTYDLADAEDSFLTNLYGALAAREKHKMMERTKRGRLEAKKQGKYLNEMLPFGWTAESGMVVQHPVEGEAVKIICQMALGSSCLAIAREMTRRGFPTKRGGKWESSTVHHILVNTALYGKGSYGEVETTFPPFISKEEWDAIQARLKTRFSVSTRADYPTFLLQGLVNCGLCGRRLTLRRENHKAMKYRYYVCQGNIRRLGDCRLRSVRADDLDPIAWEAIKGHLKTPKLIYDALALVYREKDENTSGKAQEEGKVLKRLESLKGEENRLVRAYFGDGAGLSEENFRMAIQDIRRERALVEVKLKEVRDTQLPEIHVPTLEAACAQITEGIDKWTPEMIRETLCLLVDKVTVFPDRSTCIRCRLPIFGVIHKGPWPFSNKFEIKTAPIKGHRPGRPW